MKVKITFIAETSKWDTFQILKSEKPISRKKFEENFSVEVEKVLKTFLVQDEETEKIYDVKAKIIERKDNG
jgi:hypothetical protein